MASVKDYKIDLVCDLGELQVRGRFPIIPLTDASSDAAIRAAAELEVDGVIEIDESLRCRLTPFGSLLASAMLLKSKVARS